MFRVMCVCVPSDVCVFRVIRVCVPCDACMCSVCMFSV